MTTAKAKTKTMSQILVLMMSLVGLVSLADLVGLVSPVSHQVVQASPEIQVVQADLLGHQVVQASPESQVIQAIQAILASPVGPRRVAPNLASPVGPRRVAPILASPVSLRRVAPNLASPVSLRRVVRRFHQVTRSLKNLPISLLSILRQYQLHVTSRKSQTSHMSRRSRPTSPKRM